MEQSRRKAITPATITRSDKLENLLGAVSLLAFLLALWMVLPS